MRIMNASLCVDEKLSLIDGERRRVERRLIRLDPAHPNVGPKLDNSAPIGSSRSFAFGRIQARFAWFLDNRFRGRMDDIRRKTGLAPFTLRKYSETSGAERGRAGPQSLRTFYEILRALEVQPAKLIIAAQYGANEGSFWTLMNSDICAEETVIIRRDDGHRTERRLWRLEEGKAPG